MASDNKNDPKGINPGQVDDIDDGDYVIGEDIDFDAPEADEVFEESYDSHDTSKVRARKPIGEIGGKSGGAKKMALPALALVCAVGVGSYIMMNPGFLGGASKQPMPTQTSAISSPVADASAEQGAGMPPQPTGLAPVEEAQVVPPEWSATGADMSVSPDTAAAIPPAMPAGDVPPADTQVADITEGASAAPIAPAAFGDDSAQVPTAPPTADIPPMAAMPDITSTPATAVVPAVVEPATAPAVVPASAEVPAVELPVVADAPAPPAEMPAAPVPE
ncbi:MAG TPA: hypothetical protein VIG74_00100, partial [Alphaproteobacteria bacterium]